MPRSEMGHMAAIDSRSFPEIGVEENDFQIHGRVAMPSLVMFSFILFLALCLIYSVYKCAYRWHRSMGRPTTENLSNDQAHSTSSCIEIGPGIHQSVINSLPIVSYGPQFNGCPNSKQRDVDCCICLDSFQEGEKVTVVPQCYHAFHSECLDEWFLTRLSCPLCRGSVTQ